MLTVILPGYSLHNKSWAYEAKNYLEKNGLVVVVYEWKHWVSGKMNIADEVKRLVNLIGKKRVNIIAKSIGTKVFVKLNKKIGKQINKIILCGVPFDPIGYLGSIRNTDHIRIIIFQNSHDPFVPYTAVKAFVMLANKKVKVIKHLSNTHDYPYYEEFIEFLL